MQWHGSSQKHRPSLRQSERASPHPPPGIIPYRELKQIIIKIALICFILFMCASPAVTQSEQSVCLKRELHVTNERQQAASGSFPPQKKNAWSLVLNLQTRRCAAEKDAEGCRGRKPGTESRAVPAAKRTFFTVTSQY